VAASIYINFVDSTQPVSNVSKTAISWKGFELLSISNYLLYNYLFIYLKII
jgi:hypothetical protein